MSNKSSHGIATDGGGSASTGDDSPPFRAVARAFARRWLPYWLAAAGLFLATACLGAAVGTERRSFVVPVRAPGDPIPSLDAADLFVHNARIGLYLAGGAALFGLPTVVVLAYNGFVFGATMADATGTLGPVTAAVLVAPHGVIELPALWLAGAVGLRWAHLLWDLASGGSYASRGSYVTGVPRTAGDSLVAILAAAALLALAASVEAVVTPVLARALA